jgi:hypothetical protein
MGADYRRLITEPHSEHAHSPRTPVVCGTEPFTDSSRWVRWSTLAVSDVEYPHDVPFHREKNSIDVGPSAVHDLAR